MTESTDPQALALADARAAILEGRTSLGIEFGSTRIKACRRRTPTSSPICAVATTSRRRPSARSASRR
jgi:hypothetical protein